MSIKVESSARRISAPRYAGNSHFKSTRGQLITSTYSPPGVPGDNPYRVIEPIETIASAGDTPRWMCLHRGSLSEVGRKVLFPALPDQPYDILYGA